MRLRSLVPLLSIVLFAGTGCDLVTYVEGPRPEDFQVQADASEVRGEESRRATRRYRAA